MDHKFSRFLYFFVIILIKIDLNRAQDEECEGYMKPLYCYECQTSSDDPSYCSDPFNATMLAENVSICEGHCVKWVRQPRPGEVTYVRTCSTRLNLKLMINIVCMEESRPSSGLICFCKEPRCNSATRKQLPVLPFLVCAFLMILREMTWSHVLMRHRRLQMCMLYLLDIQIYDEYNFFVYIHYTVLSQQSKFSNNMNILYHVCI